MFSSFSDQNHDIFCKKMRDSMLASVFGSTTVKKPSPVIKKQSKDDVSPIDWPKFIANYKKTGEELAILHNPTAKTLRFLDMVEDIRGNGFLYEAELDPHTTFSFSSIVMPAIDHEFLYLPGTHDGDDGMVISIPEYMPCETHVLLDILGEYIECEGYVCHIFTVR